ncbi:unnamed protein product [Vicia faba]|uniref:Uncharacterized protein n=1 Tax=Vicia faba TaxID=3906 RepID=A0AAV0Z8N7_VICFA|nr:unnamed protein product [Vicia faba]
MLKIQGSSYKIEYEGLHLLCLACGRYRNYKEKCSLLIKGKNKVGDNSTSSGSLQNELAKDRGDNQGERGVEDGPWRIVHKQIRGRKTVEGRRNTVSGSFNDKIMKGGSRFLILEDVNAINGETTGKSNVVVVGNENSNQHEDIIGSLTNIEINGDKCGHDNRRQKLNIKRNKATLATRGGIQRKEKVSGISQSGMEGIFGNLNPGDTKEADIYDSYNLIRRRKVL